MGENILDVCSNLTLGSVNKITLNFIGKGNIWLRNTYNSDVLALARFIVNEAIQNTAPGQLSVIGFDSDYSGLLAPFASLASGANKQLELIGNFKDYRIRLSNCLRWSPMPHKSLSSRRIFSRN